MHNNLEDIKFNLTPNMSKYLLEFNEIKKKLNEVEDKKERKKLERKLNILKDKFIVEFRLNNKDEILKYLSVKDKQDN